jgi:membrane dipeptidase
LRIDCHCDTVMHSRKELLWENPQCHCDFRRLRQVVDIQFMAVFPYLDKIREKNKDQAPLLAEALIERLLEAADLFSAEVGIIRNQEDISQYEAQQRLGLLISIEGGEALGGDLARLDTYFHQGVRAIGLTWNYENDLAWGCNSDKGLKEGMLLGIHDGVKPFGIAVIERANELGMVVDLAHLSYHGFWRALGVCRKPVLVSHGNCHALCPHVRNLRDEQLKALAEYDSVLGISFVPAFLSGKAEKSIEDVLQHIDYGVGVAGIDHIGIGSDFDGVETLPQGIDGCLFLSYLAEALDKRGYTDIDIHKIMGDNVYRVLAANLPHGPERS